MDTWNQAKYLNTKGEKSHSAYAPFESGKKPAFLRGGYAKMKRVGHCPILRVKNSTKVGDEVSNIGKKASKLRYNEVVSH